MKIAIVRGAFANPYELQNFEPLAGKHDLTVFTSKKNRFWTPARMTVKRLCSIYDLVGKHRFLRGVANRIFIDSHYLFGLEGKLKGFDIALCAETYYRYTQQCLNAKQKGYVKKVLCTVWENIPFNNEGIWGRKKFKWRAFAEVDLFLAVTQKAQNALVAEGCAPSKIIVQHYGVDLNKFKPQKKASGRGQNDELIILFVGRLVPEKGIFELQEVCKNLNLNLKIVSHASYGQMPQIYQDADIFVLPSKATKTWEEQYGMVLIEAMASGLPIITTNTGSISEVVGDAAILTKNLPKDLKMLSKNKELREELSKKARLRAEKFFNRDKIALQCEQIFLSLF